ncbi:MAG: uracil phosphoribosyltransferase [Candidatus Nanoarchaeia archaeon]|jgi:uracil phosphoribosyltransferase
MKNVLELKKTKYLNYLFTNLRDKKTKMREFRNYSDRVMQVLMQEVFNQLGLVNKTVFTGTGSKFNGLELNEKICGVSILRSGDSMEKAFREFFPNASYGKILIQRNEKDAKPIFFYSKLPKNLSKNTIILLDPMIGTGGSALTAIELLLKKGAKENKIIFCNLLSCKKGINMIMNRHKNVRIITGVIDPVLNSKFYLVPGLGDFGDRYYGTE